MNQLQKRIIDLSYKNKLSHIGSCLTAVNIIDSIYQTKTANEPFVLSSGHAALALYVVLEKYEGKDAQALIDKHGTHPNRDLENGIYCSSGSLGQGITAAVGMALADPKRDVYVLISDGEANEGSVLEALRIAGEQRLENLKVAVNANGYGAYKRINTDLLEQRLSLFFPVAVIRTNLFDLPPYLNGLQGHYHVLDSLEYQELEKIYASNLG